MNICHCRKREEVVKAQLWQGRLEIALAEMCTGFASVGRRKYR